jgi:hypothetical protein
MVTLQEQLADTTLRRCAYCELAGTALVARSTLNTPAMRRSASEADVRKFIDGMVGAGNCMGHPAERVAYSEFPSIVMRRWR